MFSKAEAQMIKREFWIAFAAAYPRKWLLYDTKIKDFSFKFDVDNKKAEVMLAIEPRSEELRKIYFEKIQSLQQILVDDFIPGVLLEKDYYLETGKAISKVWVVKENVSVFNRNSWPDIFAFFYDTMDAFERFFYEFKDYIEDLKTNT